MSWLEDFQFCKASLFLHLFFTGLAPWCPRNSSYSIAVRGPWLFPPGPVSLWACLRIRSHFEERVDAECVELTSVHSSCPLRSSVALNSSCFSPLTPGRLMKLLNLSHSSLSLHGFSSSQIMLFRLFRCLEQHLVSDLSQSVPLSLGFWVLPSFSSFLFFAGFVWSSDPLWSNLFYHVRADWWIIPDYLFSSCLHFMRWFLNLIFIIVKSLAGSLSLLYRWVHRGSEGWSGSWSFHTECMVAHL